MQNLITSSLLITFLSTISYGNPQQNSANILETALKKMNIIAHKEKKIKTDNIFFNYKLKPKKLTDNLWCFLGALEGPSKLNAGNMVNTCYFRTSNSYVVIDSGPSYQYAKQAYTIMKKISNLPVKTVINTHEHDDHWLGNSFYKKNFSAQIIGPKEINENYKAGDKTRMFRILPKNAIEGTKIIPVDTIPIKILKLNIGGNKFEIIPIGQQAHTKEDFFIYMPIEKILFAGDLAMNGRITSNRHGSLLGQLKAIKMMKNKEYEIFIPGHGFDTSKNALNDAEQYFTLLHQRILTAIENDVDASELSEIIPMNEFKNKAMFKALNGQNVAEAFTEIEFLDE